jgi:hypothetical protein
MTNLVLSLLSVLALLTLVPHTHEADPAVAKQASTDRIISHTDMKKTLE